MTYIRIIVFTLAVCLPAGAAQAACAGISTGKVSDVVWDKDGNGTVVMAETTNVTAVEKGNVIYDENDDVMKVCDGTNWRPLVISAPAGDLPKLTLALNTSAPQSCNSTNRGTLALNNVNNFLLPPSLCVCAAGGWKHLNGLGTSCNWN